MAAIEKNRLSYLDYMRGLMIVFVVLQHAVQGYAEQWGGRLWFIDLPDRSRFFDVMFMWTDSFIMQALFFVSGIFVIPSLNRRGWANFTWEKISRLGIPMVIAIIIWVPPLGFLKYEGTQEPGITYMEYWAHFLTPDGLRAAGFWFIAYLLLFTFAAATIDRVLPFITRWIGNFTGWLASKPTLGYITVGLISAALIGFSDLRWGTYWWMGLADLFNMRESGWAGAILGLFVARSNMFYTYVFFFILGIGVSKCELLTKTNYIERAAEHWKIWLSLLIGLSIAYSWYNQAYLFDGAFNDEIRYFLYRGGQFKDAWPIIWDVAPGILIRTTLHGFLCTTQIFAIIVLLYKFTNDNMPGWVSLGLCAYGIFYVHEPIVVWTQHMLENVGLPNFIKMLFVFGVALSASWAFTAKVLRKSPLTKHVF